MDALRHAGLGLPRRPRRLPDRGLGARAQLAGALATRRVRRHPERRARARRGACRRARAPDRVRRAPGAAEGPARPSRCVARDPPAHGAQAHGRRRRPARRPPAHGEASCARRRHRRRRVPEPGRSDGHAPPREGARRSVARAGELRDGAHAGLRVRVARRRIRHSRIPRGSRRVGVGDRAAR